MFKMLKQLTRNYRFFVTQDGNHFVLHNLMYGSRSSYKLGDTVTFNDEGINYQLHVSPTGEQNKYDINLEKID